MSVIVARALPDARDGLKPSQRRILVAMNDLNLGPRSKHRKCAKIAGDTSGNYHPHGEQVIYPTLVRLAQDFVMRYPLIHGQGNFGSIDGDPPAAMRYTEARMSQFAMLMLGDLEKDTVDFAPNYDETRKEPSVLPSKFPNLLANGSSGIAVGMSTSIPPHNLSELCNALVKVIDNPDISVEKIMKILPGPDFPTGALICGRKGIVQAYKTGRGNVTVRARAHVEQVKGGKKNIVFTEIPYQLNRDLIIERIAHAVNSGAIKGVADVRNESDREGSRLVVELQRGENEQIVLNLLYKRTHLQTTYSIILLALDHGRPRPMSIKDMLLAYRDHRIEVIRRRTMYLLDRAEARAHIVEGLRIAVANIDEVVAIIKKSRDVDTARTRLIKRFKLTEIQANAILDMRLARLTGLEVKKLEAEYKELKEKIADYKAILADENLVLDIIREDLHEMREKYGDARRTEIIGEVGDFSMEDLIAEENVAVVISHEGYIKRMPLSSYRRQHRGGKGITGADAKEGDFTEQLFIASTHDYILFFTDNGMVHWRKVYDIPQLGRTARGRAMVNLLNLSSRRQITSTIPVRIFDDRQLVMVTRKGIVKKTALSAYGNPRSAGIIAINLDKGDRLVSVFLTRGNDEIIFASRGGKAIRFSETQLRSQGRATRGVKGMSLKKGDYVVGAVTADDDDTLLTVSENGFGKRTTAGEYRTQNRGGKGLINIQTTQRNGKVVSVLAVHDDEEIMVLTTGGMIMRTPVKKISSIGRNTQGVRIIRLNKGDKVACVAKLAEESAEEGAEEEAAEQ
ncbi:MAG: DNA gyrase subunit A [Planctomycetota bacterium]|jgi:DNA gyrase subunit A